MTLGIFVEGPSDKHTIPILIRKTGYQSSIHHRIAGPQANLPNFTEMSHQIDALLNTQSRVNRVLIFIDSEGVAPNTTLRRTEGIRARLNQSSGGIPVDYVVVDHSLEGWLACDTDALRSVLGDRARIRITSNPEDHLRPAKLLERVFKVNRKGKPFRKTVDNRRIAEYVSPENISAKSPTFRRMVALLGGAAT